MNMKTKDAVYTLGLMIGIGGTYSVLKVAGMESHLFRLLIGAVVGVGIGWLSEKIYLSGQQPPGPPGPPPPQR